MNTPPSEPTRLVDDPGLGGILSDDLSYAAEQPFAYDVGAGLARFEAAMAGETAAVGATAGASGGGLKLMSILLGGVVLAGGALAIGLQGDDPAPQAQAPAAAPAEVEEEVIEPAPEEPTPVAAVPEAPAPVEEPPVLEDPTPEVEPPAVKDPSASKVRKHPKPAPEPLTDLLAREREQLEKIRDTVSKDPGKALKLVKAGNREFGKRGTLGDEREGYAVLALVGLGKHEDAQKRGERYLARHPRGTLANAVKKALGAL